MNKPACPDDYQLWPAVMGDSIDSKLQTHLEVCLDCQRRVQSLRGDVYAVRRTLSGNDKESDSSPPVSLRLPPTIGE